MYGKMRMNTNPGKIISHDRYKYKYSSLVTQSASYVSPRSRYGSTVPTRSSREVSRTYPSIFSVWVGSSTTVMVEPFQVSMMRRPLSVVTRVHCFRRRAREKLSISWANDCMTRLDTNKIGCVARTTGETAIRWVWRGNGNRLLMWWAFK